MQVDSGLDDLSLYGFRIPSRLIDVLYVRERRAHRSPNEEGGLLLIKKLLGIISLRFAAEIQWIPFFVSRGQVKCQPWLNPEALVPESRCCDSGG